MRSASVEHGQLHAVEHEPRQQRGDDDASTGPRQLAFGGLGERAVVAADHREIDARLAEQRGQAGGRARTVGRDHQPVAVAEQVLQAGAEGVVVTDRRRPRAGREGRRVGRLRHVHHGHGGRADRAEEPLGFEVEPREPALLVGSPGDGEGAGEVVLLGHHVGGAVPQALRLDEHDEGLAGEQIGEQPLLGRQPRQPALHAVEDQALGQALPVLPAPRLLADESSRPGPHLRCGQQLAGREDHGLFEVGQRTLVVHVERREAVHLVAPQVDAHGRVARGWEDVDDGPAPGHLAAVLHQLLAAVAHGHQAGDQLVGVEAERLGGP